MIYKNRMDAGIQLALKLEKFKNQPDTIVIALPRGGVIVGFEVAQALQLPLDLIFPRKIGAPFNEELAIGAITETGEGFLNKNLIDSLHIDIEYVKQTIEKEKKEAQRRLSIYRGNKPFLSLEGKTVILVDDGIATGATMKAAILDIKKRKASQLIIAVPVASYETIHQMQPLVDEIICLTIPINFYAVGQFYEDFRQITDQEVIEKLSFFL